MSKGVPLNARQTVLPAVRVLEVALAFAFWDTVKLGWHLVAVPYMNQKFQTLK